MNSVHSAAFIVFKIFCPTCKVPYRPQLKYSLLFSICLYCAEKMLENTPFNKKYIAFQLDIKQIREVEVNDLQLMYLKLKVNHVQYKVRVLHNEWLTSQQ